MLSGHRAGDAAVFDNAFLLVRADEPARRGEGLNIAGKGAVGYGAGVVAGKAACILRGAAGTDLAGEVQLAHHGPGLDVAEEARVGAVRRQAETGDRVAPALEYAGERGYRRETGAGEVQVRLQVDGDALGIAVHGAGLRKRQQVLQTVYVVADAGRLLGVVRQHGDRDGQQPEHQQQAQYQCDKPFKYHRLFPPQSRSRRRPRQVLRRAAVPVLFRQPLWCRTRPWRAGCPGTRRARPRR